MTDNVKQVEQRSFWQSRCRECGTRSPEVPEGELIPEPGCDCHNSPIAYLNVTAIDAWLAEQRAKRDRGGIAVLDSGRPSVKRRR